MSNGINLNESEYLHALYTVFSKGEEKKDRTGTGTISMFHLAKTYHLQEGFPLLTSKKMYWKGIVGELLWFLRGETNIKWLQENNINIWNEWADEDGELGPVYGYQWRHFPKIENTDNGMIHHGEVDQIEELIKGLKEDPDSRRHIVSAWNPGMLHDMALPPCHAFFQFYVRGGEFLDCQLYQRSADMFLGVPFNIASYSLLNSIIAMKVGLKPGRFHHTLGDAHIYSNHLDQVKEQLYGRTVHDAPNLWIDPDVKDLDFKDLEIDHFQIEDYTSETTLKAEIAV